MMWWEEAVRNWNDLNVIRRKNTKENNCMFREISPLPIYREASSTWTPSQNFPGGYDGKESVFNVGNLSLIPGSGRYPREELTTHSSINQMPWQDIFRLKAFISPNNFLGICGMLCCTKTNEEKEEDTVCATQGNGEGAPQGDGEGSSQDDNCMSSLKSILELCDSRAYLSLFTQLKYDWWAWSCAYLYLAFLGHI